MIEIKDIQDVVARDTWESRGDDGTVISHEIVVGRPVPVPDAPNQTWVCPVSIENFTDRIVTAYGVGPVDSLMNAMTLVKALFDKINKTEKPTTT